MSIWCGNPVISVWRLKELGNRSNSYIAMAFSNLNQIFVYTLQGVYSSYQLKPTQRTVWAIVTRHHHSVCLSVCLSFQYKSASVNFTLVETLSNMLSFMNGIRCHLWMVSDADETWTQWSMGVGPCLTNSKWRSEVIWRSVQAVMWEFKNASLFSSSTLCSWKFVIHNVPQIELLSGCIQIFDTDFGFKVI